ncbi:membrane protein [Streptosporangium jomthongense]|uniref:Urate hydroxylase PuuD n=1 Tax=Marinobacter aromaticivorans TaxID=1494078 RepID=A0ABW2IZY5_9GAMM|nr:urate hydroxylase PuuD [Marinobacter aromaticivorans]GGE78205.1 membrane protein [Streptosporangium jomthongense]
MTWTLIDIALRWLHIVFALIWIGHNYANVVKTPRFIPLRIEADEENARSSDLVRRMQQEHGTFRYASLVVLISGAFMLWNRGILVDALTLQGHHAVIGIGAWIGIIMVLNLWFVLWPHQKKVLGFVPASSEERIRCSRVTFLSSRTNTILSLPLIFFMAASSHGLSLF